MLKNDQAIKLDLSITENNLLNDIKLIIEKIKPNLFKQYGNELDTSTLEGGMSNQLYVCYASSKGIDSLESLLFRINGRGSDKFIDRNEEIETMKRASEIDLGPKLYCQFQNGICYQYSPGRTIDRQLASDPAVYRIIAETMAKMHFIGFNGLRTRENLKKDEKPFIFWKISQFLDLIEDNQNSVLIKMNGNEERTLNLTQLRNEFGFLKNRFEE